MARSAHQTKKQILTAAYGLLYREGFARVSVDAIAEASGVTKRTLYYHFESKDALVAAVLAFQHDYALRQIQGWADETATTPLEFVDTLFERMTLWASEPKWLGSGFTRITMELADLPGHPARRAASRHKAEVENWMAGRFLALGVRDAEETARQITLLVEGCLSLILIHGDTRYAHSAARAARMLVSGKG